MDEAPTKSERPHTPLRVLLQRVREGNDRAKLDLFERLVDALEKVEERIAALEGGGK